MAHIPESWRGAKGVEKPVCLPLLSQSALFVTRHHRLSRHRARRPHNLLSCISPSRPRWHATPSHGHHFKRKTCHPALLTWCPPPRGGLYSSSGHRSTEPLPPFIYLLIRLPVLAPFCLTLRLYHLSVCSRRIPRWLLFAINMLCSSLLRK